VCERERVHAKGSRRLVALKKNHRQSVKTRAQRIVQYCSTRAFQFSAYK